MTNTSGNRTLNDIYQERYLLTVAYDDRCEEIRRLTYSEERNNPDSKERLEELEKIQVAEGLKIDSLNAEITALGGT